jgi:putative transposase
LIFEFIAQHAEQWPIASLCDALEVSVSGYYAWQQRQPSVTELWQQELVAAMHTIHDEMKQRYGSPRMHAELKARGFHCSENTVAKLMKTHKIQARQPRRFVKTTDSNHQLPVAANLLARCFEATGPNQLWGADITYLPTSEGWLYLAVVEDLFSRMVVGWSMAETMESRLVVDALEMAIARRRPGVGLLAHSDRVSQYASDHYQRVLNAEGIVCSMSEVGQCWDNAQVESLFGRLKCELAVELFASRGQARQLVFDYLEVFYNRVRRHSSLGYVSPMAFEQTHNQKLR